MTKVLLVSVPFYRLQGSHYNGMNLGLAYIAATLNGSAIQCKIYNADYLPKPKYADQIELFKHYDDYKETIRNENHPIWKECFKTIAAFEPDWVGFNMFTANLPTVRLLSKELKQRLPAVKIVVGGPHATLAKGRVLDEVETVDFVIQGEGERSLLKLIQGADYPTIKGLIYREDDRSIVVNPEADFIADLDTLPIPNRDCYYPPDARIETHYITTSRGCPNKCAFCASPVIWKQQVRFRSIDNIISELKQLERLGYEHIQFQDDTFTFRKKRVIELLAAMRREKIKLTWTCDTRLNCLDEEVLREMKRGGCVRVKVGIESGNQDILKKINKGISPKMVVEKVALIKKVGLQVTAYFMIGFPGETDAQARDTVALAKAISADYYSLSVVAPYYGTRLYNEHISNNGFKNLTDHWEYFFHHSNDMIMTSKISQEVINDFLSLNDLGQGERV